LFFLRLGRSGRSLGLRGCCFLRAQRLDARSFEASCFRRQSLLLCDQFRSRLRGACGSGCLLFCRRLHVGCLSPATDLSVAANCHGLGNRLRGDSCRPATTSRGRRCSLTLSPNALLALPTRADAGDLIVGEHAHVATNRNVHLPKKADDFIGWHCEFVRQLTH